MIVSSTEVQNNFGKYVKLASKQEIIITKKGQPVARLVGNNEAVSFLSDRLVGLVPRDVNENAEREERLSKI